MIEDISDDTVGELSARFAAGKIPTEAAFQRLIEWARFWQSILGWKVDEKTYHPGDGLQLVSGHLEVHPGDGILSENRGLSLKLKPQAGLMLDENGALQVDRSVAVSSDAFMQLPEAVRYEIAALLQNAKLQWTTLYSIDS